MNISFLFFFGRVIEKLFWSQINLEEIQYLFYYIRMNYIFLNCYGILYLKKNPFIYKIGVSNIIIHLIMSQLQSLRAIPSVDRFEYFLCVCVVIKNTRDFYGSVHVLEPQPGVFFPLIC